MEIHKKYRAGGLVYGNYWGGGRGAYKARILEANSREEIISKAKEGISNGSLDDGMGYESLIGTALIITCVKSIEIEGETFTNDEENTIEFIGELDGEAIQFLEDCLEYS